MSTPFAFTGALQLPGDKGLPPDSIPMSMSESFDSSTEQVLNLTGSGTLDISLGTVTDGLKGLLIKVDASTDADVEPVYVKINGMGGEDPGEEISPGGFKANGNPDPVSGITSITIAWNTPNVVRIWALG